MIKRLCGHSSPYTFKKNEKYGRQRFEKFINKKCPECTVRAIQDLESQQKAASKARKQAERAAVAAKASAAAIPVVPVEPSPSGSPLPSSES